MGLFGKLFGGKGETEALPSVETRPDTVYSPLTGTAIALEEIPDEVFATAVLGNGCGIEPPEYRVTAPFDGVVTTVADTKHAVGMTSKDGIEILIHVGLNTVEMKGRGFDVKVAEGQKVKFGQLLMNFDAKAIQEAGYPITTAVIVTNTDDYTAVKMSRTGEVTASDPLLTVEQ